MDLDLGTETLKISRIPQLLMKRGFDVYLHAFGFLQFKELKGAETLLRQVCRLKPRAIVCNTSRFACAHTGSFAALSTQRRHFVCYDHPVELACDQVMFDRAANTALAVQQRSKTIFV